MARPKTLGRRIPPPEKEKMMQRVTAWCLTPAAQREPRSTHKLARELGISEPHCLRLTKSVPKLLAEVIESGDRQALSRYAEIVRVVAERAVAGSPTDLRMYFEHIVAPYRREQQERNRPAVSTTVQLAIGWLPESSKVSTQGEAKLLEANTETEE